MSDLTSEGTSQKGKAAKMNLIDALPVGLLLSILALLPVSSIHACRCVCKFFKTLISDEYYTTICIDSPFTTIVFDNPSGVHLLELANGYRKSYISRFPRQTKVIGSCNGLLCLSVLANHNDTFILDRDPSHIHLLDRFVVVCNPILGQYYSLPKLKIESENPLSTFNQEVYGFGFGSRSRSYKVLRISTRRNPPHLIYKKRAEAEIITVGTDHHKWRSVGYLPYPSNQEIIAAATLEGAFHWLFDNELQNITSLIAFNIEEERHYQIPIPSNIKNCKVMSVGVFRECLCVFDNSVSGQFSIWSMKKYGVLESWTLDCNFIASIPGGLNASALYPLALLKDGSVLMKSESGNFYTYHQKNKIFTNFETGDLRALDEFKGHILHSSNFRQENMLETGCLNLEESVEALVTSARHNWSR
ncbi:F-box protein At3g07870-like [Apium graveolens]|uniref:F-box protein At3g07870-like n=1 Tax=Apium graveolens TaxID=4045 RepID=UPI003D7B92C6